MRHPERIRVAVWDKESNQIDKLASRAYTIEEREGHEFVVRNVLGLPFLRGPVIHHLNAPFTIAHQSVRGSISIEQLPREDQRLAFSVGTYGQVLRVGRDWVFEPHKGVFFFSAPETDDISHDALFTGMIHLGVSLSTAG